MLLAGASADNRAIHATEIQSLVVTDSNSPEVVLHNLLHPDPAHRPLTIEPAVSLAHWALMAGLTVATLLAAGWERPREPLHDALFLGALVVLMTVTNPLFHPHHVSMFIPLVMVIVAYGWRNYGYGPMPTWVRVIFLFVFLSHVVTLLRPADMGHAPAALKYFFGGLRDFGLVLLSTLALWAAAAVLLRRRGG
jgi:hypothetical protein